eukprot:NODE_15601_length_155_cov_7.481132_g15518_i0.p2 GENE.NODE_15601_length_155_cov_7.481132_g15518_i0~~NODE_15601_length_155_cov_7.481132_g15518_i0.p2  ORF type:complete len:50 (+),score=8.84 NODE_15601_length_155_cov_7.481132_g15518_i0:1-150(+)
MVHFVLHIWCLEWRDGPASPPPPRLCDKHSDIWDKGAWLHLTKSPCTLR